MSHVFRQPLLNRFARVPVCGLTVHHKNTKLLPSNNKAAIADGNGVRKQPTLRGFIVGDVVDQALVFCEKSANGWAKGLASRSAEKENFGKHVGIQSINCQV